MNKKAPLKKDELRSVSPILNGAGISGITGKKTCWYERMIELPLSMAFLAIAAVPASVTCKLNGTNDAACR